jgi:DHA1 family L-arabinose/isopropyl-beta-D-thiogalactopyranoside export protein-like MFS transporter/DHA1 family inner membrane transport protein
LLVSATALGVTGVMTTQTDITPFLLQVPHFAARWLGALLLIGGLAGVVGAVAVGRFLDRSPAAALAGPLLTLTIALAGLRLLGPSKAYAVIGVALVGLGLSALAAALQNRTLQLSPMSVDVGSAGVSSAFNAGIAAGSYLGGVLIASHGVRSVTSVGALFTLVALVLVCADIAIARRSAAGAVDL